jgi:endo-1,4-beta-xylanase
MTSRHSWIAGQCSRRTFLTAASAAALTASSRTQAALPDSSLRALAARRGLIYGAAAATYQLDDSDFAVTLAREAAMLVPEYELKRFLVEPEEGRFDFTAGDKLSQFARDHGQSFRGHPLVWHAANPPWLEEAVLNSRRETLLTSYVGRVAGHFRGRVHSWDVVNEALRPEEGQQGGFRNTPWFKAFGPSYVDMAFHAARAADPGALLVYNDFGCEAGLPENDVFRAATLVFLEKLLSRGVPLDGYGMQGHLAAYGAPLDQSKLRRFLDALRAMGLKILVTEFDIDDGGGPDDVATRDRAVADTGRRFLDVVLDNASTVAVLTWGLTDRYLHASGIGASLFSRGLRKLPLAPDLARTPLWQSMAKSLAA